MDYILYDENKREISRAFTQDQAIKAGYRWSQSWASQGCPNVREFTVCWNGSRARQVFDSRKPNDL